MKRALTLLVLLAAVAARAAGIGAYVGKMDTDALDESLVYGAQLEFDFFPCVSLLVRGGYANDFDEFKFVGSSGTLVADDLAIVPAEAGLMLRPPPLFGLVGVYAGAGAGWYGIPGFDVKSGGVPAFRVFGEVKYQSAEEKDLDIDFKDRHDIGNLRADMDLTGVTLLAGIRIAW